ncbi:MAG: DUF6880 family protein [Burkholderiales bacterium]
MGKETSFAELITERSLAELAGDRSFARGREYFRDGAVERLRSGDGRITARVTGTEIYTTSIRLHGRELDYDCTCPMGQQGEFCKHLVATGLVWLAEGASENEAPASSEIAIRRWLDSSDKPTLVKLLMEQTEKDDELAGRLLLSAQRHGHSDPGALKETIRNAFAASGFVDYHRMPVLAARASVVPELLRELLNQGDAKAVVELAAYAAQRALKLLEQCDDSDGGLGGIIAEVAGIYREAVGRAGLATKELAKRLFDLQLADGYDFFDLESYLDALGDEGLAAYRNLAEKSWKKIPALLPGSDEDRHEVRRTQLSDIMKTLAQMDGDTNALVNVLSHDLTQPYTFFEIAETLSNAGRHDEALKWAEQGHKAFPGRLNAPLDDFLVAEYHRRQRHDDALALRWTYFLEHPHLRSYQELKNAAAKAKSWNEWREKALAALRETQSKRTKPGWMAPWESQGSILVEIFLWEGNPRAALEAARKTNCPAHLWLNVAKGLEAGSPDDAIAIYKDQIAPIVRLTNNQAYDDAAGVLRRIRDLMAHTGKAADFSAYLDSVRAQHKAKRNFMQRLDRLAVEATPNDPAGHLRIPAGRMAEGQSDG